MSLHNICFVQIREIPREIFEEASIEANEDDVALSDTLNEEAAGCIR